MGNTLRPISHRDAFALREMEQLLRAEGIRRDTNLDYSCGIYDADECLIATGSCFHNTIRCLAVDRTCRGQGLLVQVVSHLMAVQAQRGNLHVFLYTSCKNIPFFSDLGFYEIARVDEKLVFMESSRDGFRNYCDSLRTRPGDRIAAVVMNANPFTLGHRHLLEQAAGENDVVHLFLLSEEHGPIPHAVRRKLVEEGISDLPNVILQDTESYLISSATFPSYFLKDGNDVILTQAELDLELFAKIAGQLGITRRYAGSEPTSRVTGIYNRVMEDRLPDHGIRCCIIPRLEAEGDVISAGAVRQAIHDDRLASVKKMLPESTYRYFASPESAAVRDAIRREADLIHY